MPKRIVVTVTSIQQELQNGAAPGRREHGQRSGATAPPLFVRKSSMRDSRTWAALKVDDAVSVALETCAGREVVSGAFLVPRPDSA